MAPDARMSRTCASRRLVVVVLGHVHEAAVRAARLLDCVEVGRPQDRRLLEDDVLAGLEAASVHSRCDAGGVTTATTSTDGLATASA